MNCCCCDSSIPSERVLLVENQPVMRPAPLLWHQRIWNGMGVGTPYQSVHAVGPLPRQRPIVAVVGHPDAHRVPVIPSSHSRPVRGIPQDEVFTRRPG